TRAAKKYKTDILRQLSARPGSRSFQAAPPDVATEPRVELLVVVALGHRARLGARALEAIGDDGVALLQHVRVLGIFLAILLQQPAQSLRVFRVHGAVQI